MAGVIWLVEVNTHFTSKKLIDEKSILGFTNNQNK